MSSFKWKVFDTITQIWSYPNGYASPKPDLSYTCNYTLNLDEYPAMYCDIQVDWDYRNNLSISEYSELISSPQSTGLAIFSRGPDLFMGNKFLSNIPARNISNNGSSYTVESNHNFYGAGFKYLERIQLPASGLENPKIYLSSPSFRNLLGPTGLTGYFVARLKIRRYTLENV